MQATQGQELSLYNAVRRSPAPVASASTIAAIPAVTTPKRDSPTVACTLPDPDPELFETTAPPALKKFLKEVEQYPHPSEVMSLKLEPEDQSWVAQYFDEVSEYFPGKVELRDDHR